MKYKNLYVNGCSFTAGHCLNPSQTWSWEVNRDLNLEMYFSAKNGQSQESITLSSINHLANFDSQDTFVLIGITWKTRLGLAFDNLLLNLTLSDSIEKEDFNDKVGGHSRISLPRTIGKVKNELQIATILAKEYQKNRENVNEVLRAYSNFFHKYIKHDSNIESNLSLKHVKEVLSLQSYLKSRRFKYIFVDFGGIFNDKYCLDIPSYKFLDQNNIVKFDWSMCKGLPDSGKIENHPNPECHQEIAKLVKKLIKTKLI